MVAKTRQAEAELLDKRIEGIKYSVFCLSAVLWLMGASLFAVAIWMRADTQVAEMVEQLNIYDLYTGSYILIAAAVIVMIIAFVGCGAALLGHQIVLFAHTGIQVLCFILVLAGATVLLDYSTYEGKIQPMVRQSMLNLISNSQHQGAAKILKAVQEGIQCCGADGPRDYLRLLKPLPSECRDSLTGNVYTYGCAEGIPWYLESRTSWIAGLALSLCMMHIIQAVLSLLLVSAVDKEEKLSSINR